jgi:hypothetical protein
MVLSNSMHQLNPGKSGWVDDGVGIAAMGGRPTAFFSPTLLREGKLVATSSTLTACP